jgi:uncharacterized protein (DUF2141 family)
MEKTIEKVTAQALKNKAGQIIGFGYTAHFTDGTTEVIRKKATRIYKIASRYAGWVATGKTGLAAHFLFSGTGKMDKNALQHYPIHGYAELMKELTEQQAMKADETRETQGPAPITCPCGMPGEKRP